MIELGVLLAVLASTGYGLSDVLSSTVVRRHPTAALALWAQLTGLVVLGVAAALRRPGLSGAGVAWGAGAGVVGAVGVLAFYTALQRGRTSVVASVAGTGVVLPVVAGIAGGDPLGWRSGLGVAAAVCGILLVAAEPDADDPPRPAARPVPGRTSPVPAPDGCLPLPRAGSGRSSVLLAVAAAVCFGLFFVVLEQATSRAAPAASGQAALDLALGVSLAVQVGALLVTLLAATRHTRACLRPGRRLVLTATAVGLLDVAADVLVTLAVDRGPLAVVGPLASLDPVVAVLIATVVLRERLRPRTALGVGVALAGTLLAGTA